MRRDWGLPQGGEGIDSPGGAEGPLTAAMTKEGPVDIRGTRVSGEKRGHGTGTRTNSGL